MSGPGAQFEREIREQPEVLARQVAEGRPAAEEAAAAVRAFAPEFVGIAARGSSDNAARYAQYVFGAHNGLAVALAAPSLFTSYAAAPSFRRALVVGVSQSGQSPDIVAVVAGARRQGALTLAITNDPGSPLARAAALALPLFAGEERAVAASKTYTAQLAALATLSAAMGRDAARWSDLAALPGQVAAALEMNASLAEVAGRYAAASHFAVIGRGYNFATAYEVALKVKETTYVVAEPYSSADFRHGPIAVVDRGFPAILVAPSGRASADVEDLLAQLEERGADVIAVSDRPEVLARAGAPLALPAGVPEWLSPAVAVIPGQLFALELARAAGHDPDRPRGLSKVTRTR